MRKLLWLNYCEFQKYILREKESVLKLLWHEAARLYAQQANFRLWERIGCAQEQRALSLRRQRLLAKLRRIRLIRRLQARMQQSVPRTLLYLLLEVKRASATKDFMSKTKKLTHRFDLILKQSNGEEGCVVEQAWVAMLKTWLAAQAKGMNINHSFVKDKALRFVFAYARTKQGEDLQKILTQISRMMWVLYYWMDAAELECHAKRLGMTQDVWIDFCEEQKRRESAVRGKTHSSYAVILASMPRPAPSVEHISALSKVHQEMRYKFVSSALSSKELAANKVGVCPKSYTGKRHIKHYVSSSSLFKHQPDSSRCNTNGSTPTIAVI